MFDEFAFGVGQGVVEGFGEDVGVDEVAGEFLPRGEDFFLLHLVESFVSFQGGFDGGARFFQHFDVGADIVEVGEGAVAGDDFYVGGELRDGLFHGGDHALHAAAGG